MSHGTHLLVVKAENSEQAIDAVANEMEYWSGEGRAYSIVGFVSETGEIGVVEGGLRGDDAKMEEIAYNIGGKWVAKTVRKLNNDIRRNFPLVEDSARKLLEPVMRLHYKIVYEGDKKATRSDITWAIKILSYLKEAVKWHGDLFDIRYDDYKPGCYEEWGVTHIELVSPTGDESGKLFVVVVDTLFE